MDVQGANRASGSMTFHWFRFSVKSLLVLMLFVASMCLGWRVYRSARHERLIRQIEVAHRARDIALQNWKLAANSHVFIGINTAKEATCRGQYVECRHAVETATQRLTGYEKPATK